MANIDKGKMGMKLSQREQAEALKFLKRIIKELFYCTIIHSAQASQLSKGFVAVNELMIEFNRAT